MIGLVLMVIALICFIIEAANIPSRVNFMALGLALWVLAILFGGYSATVQHLGWR